MERSQIYAGPVWSKIVGPLDVRQKLDKALSFEIKGAKYSARMRLLIHSGKWDGRQHVFNLKTGIFPTGLLKTALEITNAELTDKRFLPDDPAIIKRSENPKLNGIDLSDDQLAAVQQGIAKKRGKFKMATNSGKSEICIALVECIQKKAIWLVHRKDLLYQCAERYELRTGKKAGIWGDGKYEIGETVTVAMVQSIEPRTNEGKNFLKQFEVLLVDECVHAQSTTWYSLCLACPATYRYGLSGKLPDDEGKLMRIEAVTDQEVIYETTNEQMIESGWSAKPYIHVQPLVYPDNDFDYKTAYNEMIRFNRKYASIVADEAARWYQDGKSALIIVDRMAQGVHINNELSGRNVPSQFLNGKQEGSFRANVIDKFRSGRIPVVIATSILDEGVDIPAIQVLILAAGGKSAPRQLQRVGRALRKKKTGDNRVEIIDYIHNGNYYLLDHSLSRIDLYGKEGFELVWREPLPVRMNNV